MRLYFGWSEFDVYFKEFDMDTPTPAQATSALADARAASSSLTSRGAWLRTYLLIFAAGSLALVLLIGLGGRDGAIAGTSLWIVLISVMSWWSSRQTVILRDHKQRSFLAFGGWAVLYGVTLLVGETVFPASPAFWVPAAVISTMPLVLAALWPHAATDDGPRTFDTGEFRS